MARTLCKFLAAAALFLAGSGAAWACTIQGRVVCAGTTTGVAGVTVLVELNYFQAQTTTGADGAFSVYVPDPGTYTVKLDLRPVGGAGVVNAGSVTVPADVHLVVIPSPYEVDVPGCQPPEGKCWLTGGGAKFSTIAGIPVAEHGPRVSFGGNVNPSCSPEPGEGGQWNHVDHALKLHFQGNAIVVDRCGNVAEIPPGSTSPVTPYNFIEFSGVGVLKGLSGNKDVPAGEVCFTARAEDRNEPGSAGQRDGRLVDRYFLRVFDCWTNQQLLVLERTAGAGDPVLITDGNLQLHISSCTP